MEEPRLYPTDYPYDDLPKPPKPLPMPIHGMAIDAKIERFVRILRLNGVNTIQSCQGGEGHPSQHPMVWFLGDQGEGMRAAGIAMNHGYQILYLNRQWQFYDGEIVNPPYWELILKDTSPVNKSTSF